jgi:hypothetical protein
MFLPTRALPAPRAQRQLAAVAELACRPLSQVFLCYGAHTSLELLDLYGFAIPANPHDRAYLPPALFQQHATHRPIPAAACFLHADGRPSWELLRLLRLNAASAADRRAKGHLLAAGQRASVRDDIQVLIWLVEACQAHLQGLPTSLQQDEELLGALQGRLREQGQGQEPGGVREQALLAVQWRAGHKRIVHAAVQVAQGWFVELRKAL